jgi:hypothetical protein
MWNSHESLHTIGWLLPVTKDSLCFSGNHPDLRPQLFKPGYRQHLQGDSNKREPGAVTILLGRPETTLSSRASQTLGAFCAPRRQSRLSLQPEHSVATVDDTQIDSVNSSGSQNDACNFRPSFSGDSCLYRVSAHFLNVSSYCKPGKPDAA